ncbi:helix-turn-helix transcriptional regulator [Marinobacter sp.]|uniref:helix-turn-helix transcriptional regulator n=1 Tax=Marinobacter sp. TaxID=50741 RepID=UPI003A8D8F02
MPDSKRATVTILRLKNVMTRTGLSRSTIYAKLDPRAKQHDPSFPKQVRLGGGAVGWVESELNEWLEACVSTSRVG